MLRFRSPVQVVFRQTRKAVSLGGRTIPEGALVLGVVGSANRDARQFKDPARFDVARDQSGHVAFGHGIHFCAGNAVARMEAGLAFGRLLARFPRFERAGPAVRPPRWRFRIIDELKIDLRV